MNKQLELNMKEIYAQKSEVITSKNKILKKQAEVCTINLTENDKSSPNTYRGISAYNSWNYNSNI